MTTRITLIAILAIGVTTLPYSMSYSENIGIEGAPEYSEIVDHFVTEIENSEIILAGETWTPADLEKYLYNAMAVVYYARLDATYAASQVIPQTNDDLKKLVELGYMPFWPGDPMNDWEPMKVVSPTDGFHPNALCLSVCPPEYASPLSGGGTGQVSFDLFVFGPDESFSAFASVIQPEKNKEWSSVPNGTLYGYGYRMSTVEEVEEMKRISEIYKAQQAAEAAEESNTP